MILIFMKKMPLMRIKKMMGEPRITMTVVEKIKMMIGEKGMIKRVMGIMQGEKENLLP